MTWTGCDSSSGNTCSVTANAAVTVTASFTLNIYSITTSSGGNGSVSCAPNPVSYGSSSACTIAANANYHVADVLVDGASVGAMTIYPFPNVTGNHTITASFAINTYTVSASVSGGNGTVSPTSQTVNYNSLASINITPSADYRIASITDNGSSMSIANPYVIQNVTAAHTVIVTFAMNTYTFSGFFSPVDNISVVNIAKAGQAIPVKWRITDSNGVAISDPSSFVSLTSAAVNCGLFTSDPTDAVEESASGSSGLQYIGDGYWQYNWKTLKTYSDSGQQCRTMVLKLNDGSKHTAYFKFTK